MSKRNDHPGFDLEAVRARYRAEREKRLRPEGNAQYLEVEGPLASFAADPFAGPPPAREPLTDQVDVLVVGGGFGGLLAGARLRQLGVADIRFVEKGADFGGTWYWNRYPGVACDTESYVYLPLLEEVGYIPRAKYSPGEEIFEHCRAIARKYDLYRDVCFQTSVISVTWDEGEGRWIVATDRGDRIRARFVCLATGFLHKPKLPGIPGIERFRGRAFHTSRWDYSYTGGDARGGLVGLRDKVVGLIGTGATAVQCVPHLGRWAKHLYVFQRTPSVVDERRNRPTDPEWVRTLTPGWHERRRDNFHILTAGGWAEEDLVNDGWTDITRELLSLLVSRGSEGTTTEEVMQLMELADLRKMEQVRARVSRIVGDPATAEKLKPYYRFFCKRPCFHDEYLQTFNRPNVTLVDTEGGGVERITEAGVVAGGVEYPLDCLIFATGFEVGTDYERRAGFRVIGRGGQTLGERWSRGVRTMHGMFVHGFPNCLIMSMAQSGFTVNFTYMLDHQARHIAWVIHRALEAGWRTIEVTAEAASAWVEEVVARSKATAEFAETCTPGYYNNEGMVNELTRQNGFFFGAPMEFIEILRRWRAEGRMAGLRCE